MYTYRELIPIDIRKNWSTILLSYLRDRLIIEVPLSPSVVPYSLELYLLLQTKTSIWCK